MFRSRSRLKPPTIEKTRKAVRYPLGVRLDETTGGSEAQIR